MPRASQAPDLESVVEVGESETGPAAWQVVPYPRALQGSPPPQQSSSGAASVSSCQAVTRVGAPRQGHLFENADSWCGGP